MPRKCSVCGHERLEEINRFLLAGASFRNVAEQFSITTAALFRHKQHLPIGMVKAQEAIEVAKADTLLDQVLWLRDKSVSILEKAERAGDLRVALQGVREARNCLELLGKLAGELREEAQVVVVEFVRSPEWATLRSSIVTALLPYPEARQAVLATINEGAVVKHGQPIYIHPGRPER